MRCPVVTQAACLVEGSNHHHEYYHRHRQMGQLYCVDGMTVGAGGCQ